MSSSAFYIHFRSRSFFIHIFLDFYLDTLTIFHIHCSRFFFIIVALHHHVIVELPHDSPLNRIQRKDKTIVYKTFWKPHFVTRGLDSVTINVVIFEFPEHPVVLHEQSLCIELIIVREMLPMKPCKNCCQVRAVMNVVAVFSSFITVLAPLVLLKSVIDKRILRW